MGNKQHQQIRLILFRRKINHPFEKWIVCFKMWNVWLGNASPGLCGGTVRAFFFDILCCFYGFVWFSWLLNIPKWLIQAWGWIAIFVVDFGSFEMLTTYRPSMLQHIDQNVETFFEKYCFCEYGNLKFRQTKQGDQHLWNQINKNQIMKRNDNT